MAVYYCIMFTIILMASKCYLYFLGWSDIGYSFLVGEDGNVYEGRGFDREGAHTQGYNNVGLAWSFMGSFTSSVV